jgi:hypothetical protein
VRPAALALLLALGCVRGERPNARREHGPVVARVGGEAVHADEVAAVARLERVTAREALERIVRDRALALEARRVGVANSDDLYDAQWRGRMQLLLAREVEATNAAETIPNEFFEELYQLRRVSLHHDGLVQVVHAIARVESDAGPSAGPAAMALAERFYARLRQTAGDTPSRERFEAVAREVPGLRFEEIPGFDRSGQSENGTRFAEAFVRTAWSLRPDAPLSAPFVTPFGVHVVLRVGALPPRVATPDQVRQAIVREGVTIKRSQALAALLERLRSAADVRLSETAIASTNTPPAATPAP